MYVVIVGNCIAAIMHVHSLFNCIVSSFTQFMVTGVCGLSGPSAPPPVTREHRPDTESATTRLQPTAATTALESPRRRKHAQIYCLVPSIANGAHGPTGQTARCLVVGVPSHTAERSSQHCTAGKSVRDPQTKLRSATRRTVLVSQP